LSVVTQFSHQTGRHLRRHADFYLSFMGRE
jgi:hypothetical protein